MSHKSRRGYPGHIGEHPHFLHEFAYYEASYQAARAFVMDAYQQAEHAPVGGGAMSALQIRWLASVNAPRGCTRRLMK